MQIVPWTRDEGGAGRTHARQWTAAGELSAGSWSLSPTRQRQRELARRSDDERERRVEEHGAELAARSTPADVIRESERNLDPSSRAFRSEAARSDLRDRLRNAPSAFREALAELRRTAPDGAQKHSEAAAAAGHAVDPDSAPARAAAARSASADAPPRERTSAQPIATPATGPDRAPAPAGQLLQPAATHADAAPLNNAPASALSSTARAGAPAFAVPSTAGTPSAPAATANEGGASGVRAGSLTSVAAADVRTSPLRTVSVRPRPAAGESAQSAQARANVERVLRVIRSHATAGRTSATIRLDPPELGTLRLRMELEKDALRLRVETQSAVAHRLLTDELDSLRRGLEAAGLHLERVEIRPPAPPDAEHWAPSQQQSEPQGRGQPGGAGADGSAGSGTDSGASAPAVDSPPGAEDEPAAEPRVNVLA